VNEREEGERLARVALDNGLKIKQLRNLFDVVMMESMDYAEDFIKYKMDKIKGYWKFGTEALKIIDKCGGKQEIFKRTLEHAIMLHGYLFAKPFMDLEPEILENLRRLCQRYGFTRAEFSVGGEEKRIVVFLSNFHGTWKQYSMEIRDSLMRAQPKLQAQNFRVFISQGGE